MPSIRLRVNCLPSNCAYSKGQSIGRYKKGDLNQLTTPSVSPYPRRLDYKKRCLNRVAAVGLVLLCILLTVGIIVLATKLTQLQIRYKALSEKLQITHSNLKKQIGCLNLTKQID